jgi:hypothetical protein
VTDHGGRGGLEFIDETAVSRGCGCGDSGHDTEMTRFMYWSITSRVGPAPPKHGGERGDTMNEIAQGGHLLHLSLTLDLLIMASAVATWLNLR